MAAPDLMQWFAGNVCERLYLRGVIGWTTDIWAFTGIDRPKTTGGVHYHDSDLPDGIAPLTPFLFTPRAGPQRRANEIGYLWKNSAIPDPLSDELVVVLARNGPEMDSRDPRLIEQLEKLGALLGEEIEILRGRHRLLLEPLRVKIADFIAGGVDRS